MKNIFKILAVVVSVFGVAKILLKGQQIEVNDSSNCHKLFLGFNDQLEIPQSKLEKLHRATEAIKKRLKIYFLSLEGFSEPRFAMQGSYEAGTLIRKVGDLCDFDLGMYFFIKPERTYETIQGHVKKSLSPYTKADIKLLAKCVRVPYVGDFHIDIPIYFKSGDGEFLLGSKGDVWKDCDSRLFKNWLAKESSNKPQLIRLIRYFKAWADQQKFKTGRKMPNGLVLTIWVVEYYEEDLRDDSAFILTALKILSYLKGLLKYQWHCIMPVLPHDDVLERLNSDQRTYFKEALSNLISIGGEALSSENPQNSAYTWSRLLGGKFQIPHSC